MKLEVQQFRKEGQPADPPALLTADRVVVTLVSPIDEMEYKVMLLDADDSFDVVITYPDNRREAVFSMVKDPLADVGDEEEE